MGAKGLDGVGRQQPVLLQGTTDTTTGIKRQYFSRLWGSFCPAGGARMEVLYCQSPGFGRLKSNAGGEVRVFPDCPGTA